MGKTNWFGKQSDLMRELYQKYNGDRERCIEEWAAAGERGEIIRESNTANQTWQRYASFKFSALLHGGWMQIDEKRLRRPRHRISG